MSIDDYEGSEFAAVQLLRMKGLDEEWLELLMDGLWHGIDVFECIEALETLDEYGIDPTEADAVWSIQSDYDLDLEEAIAAYAVAVDVDADFDEEMFE